MEEVERNATVKEERALRGEFSIMHVTVVGSLKQNAKHDPQPQKMKEVVGLFENGSQNIRGFKVRYIASIAASYSPCHSHPSPYSVLPSQL